MYKFIKNSNFDIMMPLDIGRQRRVLRTTYSIAECSKTNLSETCGQLGRYLGGTPDAPINYQE